MAEAVEIRPLAREDDRGGFSFGDADLPPDLASAERREFLELWAIRSKGLELC